MHRTCAGNCVRRGSYRVCRAFSWRRGGIACGIFGQKALGGLGGVSLLAQVVGSVLALTFAFGVGYAVYKVMDTAFGIRLSKDDDQQGSDLVIHKLQAYPEEGTSRFT